MLKIIKVPDESTFKESDLKPGLRVIRKSDGAECELLASTHYFFLAHKHRVLGNVTYTQEEIAHWLNRDFRRAESQPQYKTVGEVPDKVVFDYEHCNFVFPTNYTTSGQRKCVGLETGSSLSIPVGSLVTRVHGPITIDPSVTEGV